MRDAFRTLTDLALDPFARLAAASDGRHALLALGLTTGEIEPARTTVPQDRGSAANDGFSSCETCIDPGDDPDPFA